MQPKSLKLVIVTTVLIVSTSVLLGLALRRSLSESTNKNLADANMPSSVALELGPGMSPDWMSPRSFEPEGSLVDFSNIEFDGETIAGSTLTRRYMSALIAGEGCKSFVDYGDGIWVPIDESTDVKNDASTDNPFGESANPIRVID